MSNNLNQGAQAATKGASIEAERAAPCPFCGGENVRAHVYAFVLGDGEPDAYCQCGDCSTTGPNGKDEASAIAAWNRRTSAAAAGAGELPPLPEPNAYEPNGREPTAYSAKLVDQIRLDAYHAGRQSLSASSSAFVVMANRLRDKRDAEIADLRAQLAAAQHVGKHMFDALAAPASAQPAERAEETNCSDGGKCGVGGYCKECPYAAPSWDHEVEQEIDAQPDQRESAAEPDEPPTFMTNEQAEKWAWEQVKRDVGTEGWTVGDSCNYFGFFLWGWRYRAQYERQRNVAANEIRLAAAPSQAAQPVAKDEGIAP